MRIAVVGAGGHAKVAIAAIEARGGSVAAVADDAPAVQGTRLAGCRVVPIDALEPGAPVLVAIGGNRARQAVAQRLAARGHAFATVVHPFSWVAPSVVLGEGTLVCAGAVLQPDTVVGRHVIVNTSASVDHDNRIGDFCHVAPGCRLAGAVRLEEGVFLGVGTAVIPGRTIGAWATVGAGAAVVRDLPGGVTAVGVPARPRG